MANFAEVQPRKYNDYVGLPVDTYTAVGMYKQGLYEQGIQQVQSAISNVAGLDVANPAAKQYLQTKVNDITSKINNIAGGDWSNKNLVSKATGVAASVAKDPFVQKAVISTSKLREWEKSASELKDKHPELYPISAEWYDNQEVQRYLSSNNLNDTYKGSGEATRHFGKQMNDDINKALKELHPSITTTVTPSGRFEYQYDKTTTVTPTQIQNVINGVISSNPEYQKALSIDASYSYKDANSADYINLIKNAQINMQQQGQDATLKLNEILKTNPNLPIEEKEKLSNQIAEINTSVNNKINDYQKIYNGISAGDVNSWELLKQNMYRDHLFNGYIANYQQNSKETELKENINSKASLEYLKVGLDPDSGLPLKPGDKYYNWYLNSKSKPSVTPDSFSQTPVAGKTNTNNTSETLHTQIINLEEKHNANYENYLDQISLKNSFSRAEAEKYIENQDEAIRSGKSVDPDYLKFYRSQQEDRAIITANKELELKANQIAESKYPIQNLGTRKINNLSFSIDYANSPTILATFKDFNNKVYTTLNKIQSEYKGANDNRASLTADILNNTLQEYKNNKYYPLLKEIIEKGYTKNMNAILDPVVSQLSSQEKEKNDYIKNKVNTVTGMSVTVPDNSDEQKELNSVVKNAFEAEKTDEESVSTPQDIKATGVFRDPSTNELYVTYESGPDKSRIVTSKKLPIGTNIPFFPQPSQYEKLKASIEISPNKKTMPLVSSNGKLNYRIGKMNDHYYVQLQVNGSWNNISKLDSPSIGDVYEKIESAANAPQLKDMSPKDASITVLQLLNN